MSCITKLLELKADKEYLPINPEVVIEGGGNYEGYEYLITFTIHGTRCGYVALKQHEAEKFEQESNGNEYYYPHLECHGGITFYDNEHSAKNLLSFPCNDFWIGFDAAHCLDSPDLELAEKFFPGHKYIEYLKNNPLPSLGQSHKTYEYMERECQNIIEQLITKQESFEK